MSDLNEAVDGVSPWSFGLNGEGGEASWPYRGTFANFQSSLPRIIGDVTTRGDGGLTRTLPLKHPFIPGMWAERITNARGKGLNSPPLVLTSPNLPVDGVVPNTYTAYQWLNYDIRFTIPDHWNLPDSVVQKALATHAWTEFDGTTPNYIDSAEYYRNTAWLYEPRAEVIQAQQGQQFLVRDSTAIVGAQLSYPGVPHGLAFVGAPRIYVPAGTLRVTWKRVPWYPYVTHPNSFLVKYLGRVNQIAWLNWQPAELLYIGCAIHRYTSPLQGVAPTDLTNLLGGLPGPTMWCDITFVFEVTRRKSGSTYVPTGGAAANKIAANQNQFPWFGPGGEGLFFTCVFPALSDPNTMPDPANNTDNWRLTFTSFPVQILFADPSV